jgi:hypothetical protein
VASASGDSVPTNESWPIALFQLDFRTKSSSLVIREADSLSVNYYRAD